MKNGAAIRAALAVFLAGTALCALDASSKEPDAAATKSCAAAGSTTLNVRDFGAKGDGQTDDTAALRTAMARLANVLSCGASHDGKLFFPPGTYIIGGALSLLQDSDSWHSVSIEGEGTAATAIKTARNSGILGLRFTKQVPVTIRELTLIADIPHAGAAVSISMPAASGPGGPRSLVLQDVTIEGEAQGLRYFDYGLQGSGLTNPLIEGMKIVGSTMPDQDGQYIYGHSCVSLVGGWGAEIENPSSCNEMADALDVKQLGGLVSVRCRNFGVRTNYGIRVSAGGGRVDIEETHVNTFVMGMDVTNASAVTLADNLFLTFDSTTASGHGSISVDNSSNISIIDNIMWHNVRAANRNRTGINIGPRDRNVVVEGNIINELGTGVAIAPGVAGSRILNNRFYGQTKAISDNGAQTLVRALQLGPGAEPQ